MPNELLYCPEMENSMPPKARFTKEMILDAAFEIVRNDGWSGLSARNIARRLNASVGPIYTLMQSMGNLEKSLVGKAYELLREFMLTPRTEDQILNMGLGYIAFARDESALFRCFLDPKYSALRKPYSEQLWRLLSQDITKDDRYAGLMPKQIEQHRKRMIVFVYGLAVLINTGFAPAEMDNEKVAALLQETSAMLLNGLHNSLKA